MAERLAIFSKNSYILNYARASSCRIILNAFQDVEIGSVVYENM